MSSNLLEKGYEPHDVEKRWYDYWEKERLFAAEETKDERKCYSIVIPPRMSRVCYIWGMHLIIHCKLCIS